MADMIFLATQFRFIPLNIGVFDLLSACLVHPPDTFLHGGGQV